MADFRSAVVQGGLGLRAAQDYDEQQAQRTHAQRARDYGVKVMESEERRRGAADTLLEKDTEVKRLRQGIESNELAWQQQNQGADLAMRSSDIRHRQALQPGSQRLATIQQGIATGQAESQQKLQPGQATLATETQNVQLQTLREQQAASLWSLYKLGDKQGTLDLINKSEILHPGRKFSAIERGGVPARGDDGSPAVGADGKPATEEMLRMVAADGGEDVFVSVKRLEEVTEKHKPIKARELEMKGRELTEKERHNKATEGIQRQLADFRALRGVQAETSMIKNIRFMIDNKIAKDATEAYGKLRIAMEKPEEDAILSVANNLMKAPGYYGTKGWEKAVKDATRMVRTVKGSGSDAPAPGAGAPSAAAGSRTYSAGGKTFTDADIESTARQYGITTDQVKARLGIR